MTANLCWRLSVRTSPDAEDAITQLLERAFQQTAVAYRKEETSHVWISIYLQKNPNTMVATMRFLKSEIQELIKAGFFSKIGRISIRKLENKDWAESWKRHFKCIEVAPHLLIRPSWSRRKPKRGQSVITLDPGLSFGTGHHPTTAFCLSQIVSRRAPGNSQSLLDVGTGSGILALAAARLGYAPIKAFDCDPSAVQMAINNAQANQLSDFIDFSVARLENLDQAKWGRFSIVCANLEFPLIVEHASRLSNLLLPSGYLVVAGILVEQFSRLTRSLSEHGFINNATERGSQWQSGLFSLVS